MSADTYELPVPASVLPNLRVAILGAGKMGGILLQAFLKNNLLLPDQLVATVQHPDRALALSAQFGVNVGTDNLAAARQADVILLGVKPGQVPALIAEILPALTPSKMLLSFAASVRTRAIEDAAGCDLAVIRAMPNTPALLSAGATALCSGRFVTPEQIALAQRIFSTVGRTVVVDEKHMDAVTGLSGSGPAFLYIIIEALAEAGVNVGLPRDVATLLAAQTATPPCSRTPSPPPPAAPSTASSNWKRAACASPSSRPSSGPPSAPGSSPPADAAIALKGRDFT
jgi:pyrroline-5-carboxylate reductase